MEFPQDKENERLSIRDKRESTRKVGNSIPIRKKTVHLLDLGYLLVNLCNRKKRKGQKRDILEEGLR